MPDTPTDQAEETRRPTRSGLSIPFLTGTIVFSIAVGLLVAWIVIRPSSSDDDPTISAKQFVSGQADATVAVTGTAAVGQPAPKAAFTYMEGTTGSLSDFSGTAVLVNFWSSSCAPCVREMPALEKLHEQLGDEVGFLGIDVGDNLTEGEGMVTRTKVTYPQARDPKSQLVTAFGGTGLPTTVVIDATGKVVAIYDRALSSADLAAIPKQLGVG